MLDKSVPYASLKMHRKPGLPAPQFPLPQGYRYTLYRSGDEKDWARIETSVGEFDNEFAALMHFNEKFMPHAEELSRRLVFIETDEGRKVATANAWWAIVTPPRCCSLAAKLSKRGETGKPADRRAWVHWVAVDASHQGLGLGKAITSRVIQVLREIEGDVDMYLSTQTWSYKAIDIYKKCGFEPTDEKALYSRKERSHYKKALKILANLNANRYGG